MLDVNKACGRVRRECYLPVSSICVMQGVYVDVRFAQDL